MRPLTLKEAAQFLGIHPDTLKVKAAARQVPASKILGQWRFVDDDLVAFLRSGYPAEWQGLQGDGSTEPMKEEEIPCHSTDEKTPPIGGLNLASKGRLYTDLLKQKTRKRPRNTTTN